MSENEDIPENQEKVSLQPEIPAPKMRKEDFAKLPEIGYGEALDAIKAGQAIQGKIIPFLNLDKLSFLKPIVIENCQLQGMLARGTSFDKLEIRNTLILERMNFSQNKEEGKVQTSFQNGLVLEDCILEDALSLKNANILGEFFLTRCTLAMPIFLDKSILEKPVVWEGPGTLASCTMYQTKLSFGITIDNYNIQETKGVSIDLNSCRSSDTVLLKNCKLSGMFQLKKARLFSQYNNAWTMENCVLQSMDMEETIVAGLSQFSNVQFQGKVSGSAPREKYGQKAGRSLIFENDVAFVGCHFSETLSFHDARFLKYANFKNCIFAKGGNFNQAEFGAVCSFWEVKDFGGLHFQKAHFEGRTQFGKVAFHKKSSFNEAMFQSEITIFDSTASGDIFFSGTAFSDDFKIKNVTIEGGMNLQKISVDGSVKITSTVVKDRFILSESQIQGSLFAPGIKIGTWGSIAEIVVKEEVDLSGIETGLNLSEKKIDPEKESNVVPGSFYSEKAIFYKNLKLCGARIAGKLSLEGINTYGEVDLSNMSIGNDLLLSKSYFRGTVQVGGTRCALVIDSYKSRYKEEACFNYLRCQKFTLNESSFDGGFTMRGTQVDESLVLNNVDVDGKADLIKCRSGQLYFYHFLADHFLIRKEEIGDMVSSEKQKNYLQAKNEYGTLKEAFQNSNHFKEMDWAYYRFCLCNRKNKNLSFSRPWDAVKIFVDWLFLDKGFGYGTKPMNIAGIALSIVLIFAGLFYYDPSCIVGKTGPLTNITIPDAFYLSLVTFASMDYGDFWPAFEHGFKHLFALEGILGIFLVTLFVATVSRKIIRA
ncbi:MAG: potassium channel family protein [Candidatus Brocadiae bacterium]|nr:potassium channel family protein [Candidatus Brocadiia bacterium]